MKPVLFAWLMAAAVVSIVPIASAASPDIQRFDVNRTRVISASPFTCSFDVVRHSQGVYTTKTFYDASGAVVREVSTVAAYSITDTNPLTGKSVTSRLGGPLIVEPQGDGTEIVTINGNDGHITVPGEGPIFSNVGRIVFTAPEGDPFTIIDVLFVAGQYADASPFPAECAALS